MARDKNQLTEKLYAWALLALPTAGFVAAVAFSVLVRFSWVDIALCAVFYGLTALGITGGFHRLFSHQSYKAAPWVRYPLAVLGCMAVQGPTLFWVASHRRHHRFSDQMGDPHSPRMHADGRPAGFWHAQVGWVFEHDHENWARFVPDLLRDKTLVRIDRLYFVWLALSLLLPAAIGGAVSQHWTGAVGGLLWGGLARTFLWHHATWSINSLCHMWGDRPYQTSDTSTNNAACAMITLGEGWHNNHHAFPASARHGLQWYQLDMTYLTLKALEKVGGVSALVLPDAKAIANRSAAPTATDEALPQAEEATPVG